MTPAYHVGKLKPFAQIIAVTIKNNPHLAEDPDTLWNTIIANVPALAKKDTCPNCQASMQEYVFEFDLMDALLLFSMGQQVRHQADKLNARGVANTFTEANQVKTTQLSCSYAARSRTTQCSKLGLIAKMRSENGKQKPGTWVITARGWKALGGLPVPKSVRVWRGEIMERTEEMTTLYDAFQSHEVKVRDLQQRGKKVRSDYTPQFSAYDPQEWIHYAGLHQGTLV